MSKKKTSYIIIKILFVLYFLLLIKAIVFKHDWSFNMSVLESWNVDAFANHLRSANLVPFRYIKDSYESGGWQGTLLVYNVIAFIPLGILYKLSGRKVNCIKAFIIGMFVSFCLEMVQLVTLLGEFDIDDIVLNVTGTVIGYLAAAFLSVVCKGKKKIRTK